MSVRVGNSLTIVVQTVSRMHRGLVMLWLIFAKWAWGYVTSTSANTHCMLLIVELFNVICMNRAPCPKSHIKVGGLSSHVVIADGLLGL